ncbi:16S rRNA (guanine(966)-N(2))-methyltransferase RsmD [Latilactobacillus graminis]|uniref:RNA methyltransferase, RsmD family n=2 Tax=Latilactobacillus graminis TaxID=60519 RepID=A0AA89L4I8_9LACO|nr:16S rRNA (guanine(966)-N(2))-methyltransferase RsmD [Latilactobacillus graminis]KRM23841.1 RNA methyltransferase, RsmD family [Latilactobacillus graminis DSM 20719]QFP79731.1 16S rRNA (guanine(966)-N(2))-methyltransferase RsmD [Latilactobacillus graminis]
MRIIAGEFGGRRLKAVPGTKTRPTTDKVKEAMFSMLGQFFDGGQVLDLYAGSGGLAIEAVSRGMDHAYLVDRQYAAIQTIEENIAVTKMPECFTIWKTSAEKALVKLAENGVQFNLILLDPPYREQQMLLQLQQFVDLGLLAPDATILCETDTTVDYPTAIPHYRLKRQQNYGITEVTIFKFID